MPTPAGEALIAAPPIPAKPVRAFTLGLLIAAWAVGVGAGIWVLWAYANRPGPAGAAAASWPADSALRPDPSRPTMIMFIHPECPCSRASIEELNRLLAQAKD